MNIENKVIKTIKNYQLIENGDKIVLAVSGGPDSMCMLNLLVEFIKNKQEELFSNVQIVVAHVNHQIREEALADEQYVKNYCQKNGIEFYLKSIDVEKMAHTNKIGTEEAGRMARYQFFQEVLEKVNANKIAVAHNKNDKIETIFMHLLRGSGVEGLRGMEAKRENIIRPLMECQRNEIENYCQEKQLNPRIDKTNFENIYHRNKIRNVVIPYIQKEFNSNIIATMDRFSNIVALEDEYIENQTIKIYQELLVEEKENEIVVELKKFNLQEKVIKARLIRYIIKRLFRNYSRDRKNTYRGYYTFE